MGHSHTLYRYTAISAEKNSERLTEKLCNDGCAEKKTRMKSLPCFGERNFDAVCRPTHRDKNIVRDGRRDGRQANRNPTSTLRISTR